MALKTLIFGIDDIFGKLKPYYMREIRKGTLEIVAYAVIEGKNVRIVAPDGKSKVNSSFNLAIISSKNDFYKRMKFLEAQGFPRNRIIDGRVFKVPNLDFPRLIKEDIAYGVLEKKSFKANSPKTRRRKPPALDVGRKAATAFFLLKIFI